MSEIWQFSATELARRIAKRELSSVEVVNAHLARIDAVNPALNAIVKVLGDEARAEAAAADRKLAAGENIGPLHGVPFTVKENIDMVGLPTTWGVPALAQAITPMDAPVVERMRAAGAIPIGRTNLPCPPSCAWTRIANRQPRQLHKRSLQRRFNAKPPPIEVLNGRKLPRASLCNGR